MLHIRVTVQHSSFCKCSQCRRIFHQSSHLCKDTDLFVDWHESRRNQASFNLWSLVLPVCIQQLDNAWGQCDSNSALTTWKSYLVTSQASAVSTGDADTLLCLSSQHSLKATSCTLRVELNPDGVHGDSSKHTNRIKFVRDLAG